MPIQTQPTLYLYWFSGSGNTLLAAQTFADQLRQEGENVELRAMETFDPSQIDVSARLGLAFPTHCFSIPFFIRKFLRGLPNVSGTEVLFIGTHGAFSGGVCGPLKRMMSRKGYRCSMGHIFCMPDSFFPFTSEKFNEKHRSITLKRVRRLAQKYHQGKTYWFYLPVLSDLFGFLLGTLFISRKLCSWTQTTIHANAQKCLRCGECVRQCPVGALEQKTSDALPIPNQNCINCLRCVAVCPTDAMKHFIGFKPYRSALPDELQKNLNRFKSISELTSSELKNDL